MNITPIQTFRFSNYYSQNVPSQNNRQLQTGYNTGLSCDTVSFKRAATQKFCDILEKSAFKRMERLNREATVYMDVLESVANALSKYGVSFDRAYCEKHAVKSPESVVSKVRRAKTFHLRDRIRATLYCSKIYDLSVLNDKILPELKKRGYVVANDELPVADLIKRGYPQSKNISLKKEISVPDVDIRLADVSEQAVKLSPELKYAIGKPQKSGYEDIQIRFVKEDDAGKNPVFHELIILFGPNYSREKHYDSEKIYFFTRKFKELNLMQYSGGKENEAIEKAKRYMELITKTMNTEVTSKAYENAKNMDIYGIKEPMPIKVSSKDVTLMNTYFDELIENLNAYYDKIIDLQKQLKKPELASNFKVSRSQDLSLIKEIKQGLLAAVEFYNKGKNTKSHV